MASLFRARRLNAGYNDVRPGNMPGMFTAAVLLTAGLLSFFRLQSILSGQNAPIGPRWAGSASGRHLAAARRGSPTAALNERLLDSLAQAAEAEVFLEASLKSADQTRRLLQETVYVSSSSLSLPEAKPLSTASSKAVPVLARGSSSEAGSRVRKLREAVETAVAQELGWTLQMCLAQFRLCRALDSQWLQVRQQEEGEWRQGEDGRRLMQLREWAASRGFLLEDGAPSTTALSAEDMQQVEEHRQLARHVSVSNSTSSMPLASPSEQDSGDGPIKPEAPEALVAQELDSCRWSLRRNCPGWPVQEGVAQIKDRGSGLVEGATNHSVAESPTGQKCSGVIIGPAAVLPNETEVELGGQHGEWRGWNGGEGIAPSGLWKRDPTLYTRKVNVTFILQYFKHPRTAPKIIDRLYQCTEGRQGLGQLPGVTSELIVHADEPSAWTTWLDAYQKTERGHFVTSIFSHNIHEARGYNRAMQISSGGILVLLQDDKVPPDDCSWLAEVLKAFHHWPRLAIIGLWKASMSHAEELDSELSRQLHIWRDSDLSEDFPIFDTVSNVRMHFVTQANIGPLAVRRNVYEEVGLLDEGVYGEKGESGIFQDEDLSVRIWLAGHQVGQLFLEKPFKEGPEPGGTHVTGSLSNYIRERNLEVHEIVYKASTLQEHGWRLQEEVLRLNGFLGQWHPKKWPPET